MINVYALLIWLLTSPQALPGVLKGEVVDVQGAAIPGATITVMPAGDPRGRVVLVTTMAGRAELKPVAPGLYDVTATLTGFAPDTRQVSIAGGEEVNVRLTLRPGATAVEPVEEIDRGELDSFLARVTGPDWVRCGTHYKTVTADALRASLACALDANPAHRPFQAVLRYYGMDSYLGRGLIGRGDGVILLFEFDTLGAKTYRPCRTPTVADNPRPDQWTPPFVFACGG
jgi:hypothetical protein